jgi:hypothetical protein
MEYAILYHTNPAKLAAQVEVYIRAGWQLHGSLVAGIDSSEGEPVFKLFQAMTREK